MKLIKVGGAALNQIPMDWDGNKERILKVLLEAKANQVSLLCLPELCISGYGCEDMFYSEGVQYQSLSVLDEIIPHTCGMVVSIGLPLRFQNRTFNVAALMADGKLCGFVAKQFLANNGIHYEARWFTAWPEGALVQMEFQEYPEFKQLNQAKSYPMGDLYFAIGGVKIGFEICEDAWVATRPGRKLFKSGVDLILNPSASHFAFDKMAIRERFVLEGSRAFGVGYVYSNLLGNEAGRAIYDGSVLIASAGKILAHGRRFSFRDYQITTANIDIEENRLVQAQSFSTFSPPGSEENKVSISFAWPEVLPNAPDLKKESWELGSDLKEQEFARAMALGLFDYMRKSYSNGFVVSLSGGADSAAVASCCFLMLQLAAKELGLEVLKEKLGYIRSIGEKDALGDMVSLLLTTAYQPTENSGEVTRNAASTLAKAIGASYMELDINNIFQAYKNLISEGIQRQLTWEEDDIALQNIQARVRAPSVWMLANIKGALLLSTSNRSEAAVGYATMDGDTSGGLSPIAGIDKAFLRKWLRWLEQKGPGWAIPALKAVNEQQPTAELRPKENKQTDEGDLMPYDLLDAIEEAAIRDKKMPVECFKILKVKYPQYTTSQLKEWTEKFFRLWSRNQWKRERYAPSFHVDDKNLDPKTWCRFPILSGGFKRELAVLAKYVEEKLP